MLEVIMYVTSTWMFKTAKKQRDRIQNLWERYGKPPCQAEYL